MIDYRIPTFLTLYELMNYRRTAEQLKLSQPAVTQQIHALERDYGCRLFTYDGSRLYRTPEAEKLAQYARVAVYNDQRMRQELAAPKILTLRSARPKRSANSSSARISAASSSGPTAPWKSWWKTRANCFTVWIRRSWTSRW